MAVMKADWIEATTALVHYEYLDKLQKNGRILNPSMQEREKVLIEALVQGIAENLELVVRR